MEYQEIATTGLAASRLGFGCSPMSSYDYGVVEDAALIRTVREAHASGINYFDAADVYGFGRAEELLAEALGEERHNVILSTKFGLKWDDCGNVLRDTSRAHVFRALDESLRRLKVDCIALYQLHWPDGRTPIEETMEALAECQQQGKIRYIGCSNLSCDVLERSRRLVNWECIQLPFNLFVGSRPALEVVYCRKKELAMFAHSALARGLFTGKYEPGDSFAFPDTRLMSPYFQLAGERTVRDLLSELETVAKECGRTTSQVAIRWVLQQSGIACVVVGAKSHEQVKGNCGAMGWTLSQHDMNRLTAMADRIPFDIFAMLDPRHGRK